MSFSGLESFSYSTLTITANIPQKSHQTLLDPLIIIPSKC